MPQRRIRRSRRDEQENEGARAPRRGPEQRSPGMIGERVAPARALENVLNAPPGMVRPQNVLALQRTVGNQAVQRLLAQRQPAQVRQRMSPNVIALKRRLKRLDFVRIKRKDAKIAQKALSLIGLREKPDDAYGHWWLEIGDLKDRVEWKPQESYGWWPSRKVNVKSTFAGVPGLLNRGKGDRDPHHDDPAPEQFHPAYEVDDNSNYNEVRERVINEIQGFARGFQGSWNWRLGWGKNCHTFQQRLKTAVGLHNKQTDYWFRQPEEGGTDTSEVLRVKRDQRLMRLIDRLIYDGIGEDLFSTETAKEILKGQFNLAGKDDWAGVSAEVKAALAQKLDVSPETLQLRAENVFRE